MAETTPTHRIKVGLVDVAIWANTGKTGTFYNVTASRSFKQGDDWKHTSSFGFEDLPVLEKAIAMAWTWIHEARSERTE